MVSPIELGGVIQVWDASITVSFAATERFLSLGVRPALNFGSGYELNLVVRARRPATSTGTIPPVPGGSARGAHLSDNLCSLFAAW